MGSAPAAQERGAHIRTLPRTGRDALPRVRGNGDGPCRGRPAGRDPAALVPAEVSAAQQGHPTSGGSVKMRPRRGARPLRELQPAQKRSNAPPSISETSRWISASVTGHPLASSAEYRSARQRARISREWLHL